jgi:hypothetical protein
MKSIETLVFISSSVNGLITTVISITLLHIITINISFFGYKVPPLKKKERERYSKHELQGQVCLGVLFINIAWGPELGGAQYILFRPVCTNFAVFVNAKIGFSLFQYNEVP